MSQFWHAHWAEENFKPSRLQNWEVPRWHPQWPTRHCTITKFVAHSNGRIFASFKRSNPWGDFKGTWEIPSKINRATAKKLSAPNKQTKRTWEAFKIKHKCICQGKCIDVVKQSDILLKRKEEIEFIDPFEQAQEFLHKAQNLSTEKCKIKQVCRL